MNADSVPLPLPLGNGPAKMQPNPEANDPYTYSLELNKQIIICYYLNQNNVWEKAANIMGYNATEIMVSCHTNILQFQVDLNIYNKICEMLLFFPCTRESQKSHETNRYRRRNSYFPVGTIKIILLASCTWCCTGKIYTLRIRKVIISKWADHLCFSFSSHADLNNTRPWNG